MNMVYLDEGETIIQAENVTGLNTVIIVEAKDDPNIYIYPIHRLWVIKADKQLLEMN